MLYYEALNIFDSRSWFWQIANFDKLQPFFVWISPDIIKKTFQNTTQLAHVTTGTLLKKVYKSQNPVLNVIQRGLSLSLSPGHRWCRQPPYRTHWWGDRFCTPLHQIQNFWFRFGRRDQWAWLSRWRHYSHRAGEFTPDPLIWAWYSLHFISLSQSKW